MSNNNFKKPPLTEKEKEKKAEEFLSFLERKETENKEERVIPKKEPVKPLYIRVPTSLWEDIHEIMALTGMTKNSVCLEILRPSIKKKLKDLKEG